MSLFKKVKEAFFWEKEFDQFFNAPLGGQSVLAACYMPSDGAEDIGAWLINDEMSKRFEEIGLRHKKHRASRGPKVAAYEAIEDFAFCFVREFLSKYADFYERETVLPEVAEQLKWCADRVEWGTGARPVVSEFWLEAMKESDR